MAKKRKQNQGIVDFGPKMTPRYWAGNQGYMTLAEAVASDESIGHDVDEAEAVCVRALRGLPADLARLVADKLAARFG